MDPISIDNRGFVWVDNVKVARLSSFGRMLEFYDRNKKRSERRGSCFVYADIDSLISLINLVLSSGSSNDKI